MSNDDFEQVVWGKHRMILQGTWKSLILAQGEHKQKKGMNYSIFLGMRKEAVHIQKSKQRRCLFFVEATYKTRPGKNRKKKDLLSLQRKILHWIQLHQNAQLNRHFKGTVFPKFSQHLQNNLKKFFPQAISTRKQALQFLLLQAQTWIPALSTRIRWGDAGEKPLLWILREFVHPEKQVLSCRGRRTLGGGWCWYHSRI